MDLMFSDTKTLILLTDVTQFTRTATFMLPCKCEINLAVLRKVRC